MSPDQQDHVALLVLGAGFLVGAVFVLGDLPSHPQRTCREWATQPRPAVEKVGTVPVQTQAPTRVCVAWEP